MITVVNSCYNQNEALKRNIPLWLDQGVHMVVCDDGSDPKPTLPDEVDYVWQPDEGFRQSASLQNGLDLVTTPFVAFTDPDAVPNAGYIDALMDVWEPGIMCLSHRQFKEQGQWTDDWRDWSQFTPTSFRYGITTSMFGYTDDFRAVGGWCKDYVGWGGLDWDLTLRWIKSGRTLKYVPEAVCRFDEARVGRETAPVVRQLLHTRFPEVFA